MEKIKVAKLETEVFLVKGEKDGKKYKFISYEMLLPSGNKVNMTETEKNLKLSKASKILFEEKIKAENK